MSTEERDARRLSQLFAALENDAPPAEAPAWPEEGPEGVVDALFSAIGNDPPPPDAPDLPAEIVPLRPARRPGVWVAVAMAAALLLALLGWSLRERPEAPEPLVQHPAPGEPALPALPEPSADDLPIPDEPMPVLVERPDRVQPVPPAPAPPSGAGDEPAVVDAWEPPPELDEPGLIPKGLDEGGASGVQAVPVAASFQLILVPDGAAPGAHERLPLGSVLRFRLRSSSPAELTLCVQGHELTGALWTGAVPDGQRDLHGVLYLLEQTGRVGFGLDTDPGCGAPRSVRWVQVVP